MTRCDGNKRTREQRMSSEREQGNKGCAITREELNVCVCVCVIGMSMLLNRDKNVEK